MQKLSNTIKKQTVNLTEPDLKYSKVQFDNDFPVILIYEGREYRRGVSCPVGYFDSKENRIEKYERDEAMNKYYDSPEFASEYDRMQFGSIQDANRKKREQSEALEVLGLTVEDYTEIRDAKRKDRYLDRIIEDIEYIQKYTQKFLPVGKEETIGCLLMIDHVKSYIQNQQAKS